MKKNITINLFGTLYAIDEDAYELLNRYLSDMKKYFSSKKGGEEIADDIEHRVAELMQEQKASGIEVVTITHIKEIIERIGSPEEMDDKREGDETPENPIGHKGKIWFEETFGKKRLYRNPDDKVLAGVISGISYYFSADPVWLRLLTVLVACFSLGTILLVYIILALVIPEAATPEDRLRMQGKPVNMETLREEIVNTTENNQNEKPTKRKRQSGFTWIFKGLLIFVLLTLAFPLFVLLMCIILGISVVGVILNAVTNASADLLDIEPQFKLLQEAFNNPVSLTAGIALLVLICILLYFIIHFIMRVIGKAKSLGKTGIVLLIGLVIAFIVLVASSTGIGLNISTQQKIMEQELAEKRKQSKEDEAISWLTSRGWEIVRHEHTEKYIRNGQYYTGDKRKEYIDASSEHPDMNYTLERTIQVSPGVYTLEAVVRTNGEGPEIYLYDSKGVRHSSSFPIHGNNGGPIWEEATALLKADSTLTGTNRRICEANKGKGYGWSRISINDIHITDTIIRYGVSNRSAGGYWNGTWFSATDFKLKKMK